jgi:acyl-[acyl carrier protein]--UDP-N-acetylglucosamine O-acyltransferase
MFTEPDWKNHASVKDSDVTIGDGTIIRERVIINYPAEKSTVIGSNCYIMNTCFVGHDCTIGDGVTLCPHVCVAGHVTIGDYTTVGMNSSIHQGSVLGKCCMIGANAFFKGTSPNGITWVGVPAKPLKVNVVGIERSNLSDTEKQKMILDAQLFIDNFKRTSNVKGEDVISSPDKKAGNVILNRIRRFKFSNIFNCKFRK